MSLSVSTAGSGESPMMRLVKALKPLGDRVLVRHLGLSSFPIFLDFVVFHLTAPNVDSSSLISHRAKDDHAGRLDRAS